jgi:uncharacterized protein YbjT (DUF2867 family)
MTHTRICILGGTGFVGSRLARRLAANGRSLRILTRRRERHRDLLVLPGVELIEANAHQPSVLTRQLSGCDVVVNLVGILNEKGDRGAGFGHAHVELAGKVVNACRDSGVRRVLHMSALGADAEHGPSHYLRTKGAAEDLMHAAADLQVTSFRPSVIFGPGDSFFTRFAALLRLSPVVFPLACPDSGFSPVYVGDVAAAFAAALDDDRSVGDRLELCGPRHYTLKELVEYAARCAGLHRTVIGLGHGLSRLQASVLEHVPGKPFSRDNYRSLQLDSVCRHNALPELGIEPTAIETVVPRYLGNGGARGRFDGYRRQARRG